MLNSILLALSILVSACTLSQDKLSEKKDYKKLSVDDIQIIDNYNPPFDKPHIEHLIRNSPNFMIKRWIDKHLVPKGDKSILRVVIDDGKLVQKLNADRYEYEINIDLTLSLIENRTSPGAEITKNILINKVTYSKTAKNPKADKEFFNKMIKELIEELASKIDQALNNDFYNLLIP